MPLASAIKSNPVPSMAKSSVFLSTAEVRQPPGGSSTKTTHDSFGKKMGDAFTTLALGIVLMVFSFPVMWVNEKRSARLESIISLGKVECTNVGCDEAKLENRGNLVRAYGGITQTAKPIQDDRFMTVKFDRNCVRLRTVVEAYQWKEYSETTESKDSIGGGTTKTTTYRYKHEWSDERIDSQSFNQSEQYVNVLAIDTLSVGSEVKSCERVEYGDGFLLPGGLVDQLSNFEDAGKHLGDRVDFKAFAFEKNADYYFYPKRSGSPKIGDMRVKFEHVPDGPVTVMALQVASEDVNEKRDTFLPYRMISRGICCWGISDDEKKQRLINEGKKTSEDLYKDNSTDCGPFASACCCCTFACNAVEYLFSGLLPPQVFKSFVGDLSVDECWNKVESEATLMKWVVRLVGWLMLLIGTYALFAPLIPALDIIPFLGPYMGSFVGAVIYILCFLITLIIATFIISFAYLIYHPLVGVIYLAIACAGTAGLMYMTMAAEAKGPLA